MTGLEPFLLEAAKGLTGLVIKAGWEMANIPIDKPVKQLIFRASQQYVRSYTERHGILKVNAGSRSFQSVITKQELGNEAGLLV